MFDRQWSFKCGWTVRLLNFWIISAIWSSLYGDEQSKKAQLWSNCSEKSRFSNSFRTENCQQSIGSQPNNVMWQSGVWSQQFRELRDSSSRLSFEQKKVLNVEKEKFFWSFQWGVRRNLASLSLHLCKVANSGKSFTRVNYLMAFLREIWSGKVLINTNFFVMKCGKFEHFWQFRSIWNSKEQQNILQHFNRNTLQLKRWWLRRLCSDSCQKSVAKLKLIDVLCLKFLLFCRLRSIRFPAKKRNRFFPQKFLLA